jgi:hypothetical protein
VECRAAHHEVHARGLQRRFLELAHLHGERKRRQPFARVRRQVLAELHGVDPEPALEQRERGVARPAANLESVRRRGHEGGHGIE